MTSSRFITYWRAADAALAARRRIGLTMGRAHLYWLHGFTPELAAEAEIFRGRV